jgi:signal transduction histidine kinase
MLRKETHKCRCGKLRSGKRLGALRIDRAILGWLQALAAAGGLTQEELLARLLGTATPDVRAGALVRLGHLQEISALLSRATTTEEVIEVVAECCRNSLGASLVFVARLDDERAELELLCTSGIEENLRQFFQDFQRIALSAPVPLAEAVRTLVPVWLASTAERVARYPHLTAQYAQSGVEHWMSLPLVVEGKAVGGMSLGFAGECAFDEEDREYVLALASQCALALERSRLYLRERAARAEAEEGQRRAAFLAEVSALLAGSLDYEVTLARVARLAVPVLADWCAIDILDDDGEVRRLAVAHTDPARVEWAYELQRRYPFDPDSPRGVANVLRTGASELYPQIDDALLVASARSPDHLEALRQVGFSAAIVVPLAARGRVFGAVTLVMAESGRHYDAQDLRLAEDLAHRSALAIDNARLYSEAQWANRAKDEFLAVLSHELRTPLNPIIGWTQLMRRGTLPPSQQVKALEIIERNGKLQNQLIEDLLDVSRIAEGKLSFQPRAIDLLPLVQAAVEAVRHPAEQKEVALLCRWEDRSLPVTGDPTRLSQVCWNLLTNAIKFTPVGGQIHVTLERCTHAVRLSVQDTGIGIHPRFLPHVFERFRQADSSSTRKQGGLGLGLFIVRYIVELHGGKITAHSEGEGRGARFVVELPVGDSVPVV